MNLVVCDCGWISFAVSKETAEFEVASFNRYFDTLSEQEQKDYYGGRKANIKNYRCLFCGGTDFRPATEEDEKRANDHTINSVIA